MSLLARMARMPRTPGRTMTSSEYDKFVLDRDGRERHRAIVHGIKARQQSVRLSMPMVGGGNAVAVHIPREQSAWNVYEHLTPEYRAKCEAAGIL